MGWSNGDFINSYKYFSLHSGLEFRHHYHYRPQWQPLYIARVFVVSAYHNTPLDTGPLTIACFLLLGLGYKQHRLTLTTSKYISTIYYRYHLSNN